MLPDRKGLGLLTRRLTQPRHWMATATTHQAKATASRGRGGQRPADVFVVFGISGDLAKVMTFHSLYRLEARGLLKCPVVGVAFDDWTDEDLRKHATQAIRALEKRVDKKVLDRLTRRLSYVQGDFAEPDTYERLAKKIKGAKSPVFYLEI